VKGWENWEVEAWSRGQFRKSLEGHNKESGLFFKRLSARKGWD
jgi:hypothetical protein